MKKQLAALCIMTLALGCKTVNQQSSVDRHPRRASTTDIRATYFNDVPAPEGGTCNVSSDTITLTFPTGLANPAIDLKVGSGHVNVAWVADIDTGFAIYRTGYVLSRPVDTPAQSGIPIDSILFQGRRGFWTPLLDPNGAIFWFEDESYGGVTAVTGDRSVVVEIRDSRFAKLVLATRPKSCLFRWDGDSYIQASAEIKINYASSGK